MAMFAGGVSGALCLIGGVLLLKRRLFNPRVRATTAGADILILSLLVIQCALGLLTIPSSAQHMGGSEMMKLVGWAQSVVTSHDGASQHLGGVVSIFRLRLVLGMTLFLLFPFSCLVHIWSVPVKHPTREYQLVQTRHQTNFSSHRPCFGGVLLWARYGVSCRMRFAYPTYRGGHRRSGKRGAIGQN